VGIDEQELAQARANRRELAWVNQRLTEVLAERERVTTQLAAYEKARDYEQADVDKLTKGVGRFFRMVVDQIELTKEQQELAAAQLLCDEMEQELRAIDVELAHLHGRAAKVADAEARYQEALDQLEEAARARGHATTELEAIAEAEVELFMKRHELAELIRAAIDVQQTLEEIVNLARDLNSGRSRMDGEGDTALIDAISGLTSERYRDLCRCVAYAQQGLRTLEQSWAHVTSPLVGAPMQINVELPSLGRFVTRDLLFGNETRLRAILDDVSRASSTLSTRVGELRARDASYARALAECSRMRAHLLDPNNDAPYR